LRAVRGDPAQRQRRRRRQARSARRQRSGRQRLFFVGALGSGLRASLDVRTEWFAVGASHAHSLAILNAPALIDFTMYTTSAVSQVRVVTTLGAITSNGNKGRDRQSVTA